MTVGAPVIAVLEEDGEWHEAVVVETKQASGKTGPPRVVVKFVEWPKVQENPRTQVVDLRDVDDDEDVEEAATEGECELCGRGLKLTFHHLIPKQTHSRYLANGRLPCCGVAEAALAKGMEPETTRHFLNSYGSMLCRFCHTTVHRFAPNAVLAERFSTVDALRETPQIQRFAAFAGRQKVTQRR